jgi:hypothetical protein
MIFFREIAPQQNCGVTSTDPKVGDTKKLCDDQATATCGKQLAALLLSHPRILQVSCAFCRTGLH